MIRSIGTRVEISHSLLSVLLAKPSDSKKRPAAGVKFVLSADLELKNAICVFVGIAM